MIAFAYLRGVGLQPAILSETSWKPVSLILWTMFSNAVSTISIQFSLCKAAKTQRKNENHGSC